jgi:hypothetical protein
METTESERLKMDKDALVKALLRIMKLCEKQNTDMERYAYLDARDTLRCIGEYAPTDVVTFTRKG